ncbi:MAG TPA: hypothetical protein VE646_11205 [Actinomycetota bacterium]|jgi:hypothetical protein|nr:hypothetical protein [Actinomycetota bacterium]
MDAGAFPLLHGRRRVRRMDAIIIAWVVLWFGLSGWIGYEIWTLQRLSDTLVSSSRALDDTSSLLGRFADLPLVGGSVTQVQRRIEETAGSARLSAASTRNNFERLSLLLAVAVFILTVIPIVVAYLPHRLSWGRDRRTVRRLLASSTDEGWVQEQLARRAIQKLPYHVLSGITEDPWGDVRARRYEDLADAELNRLGLGSSPD